MRQALPYGRQSIDEDDILAVVDVLRGEYLTTGPAIAAFEEAFAARVGARYAVACANGTAALHLASMAAGLGAGDRVVVPTLTFLATANAPRFTGAEVVFSDCDPETALVTPDCLEAALERAGPSAKAVFVVHMNGQACDLGKIQGIVQSRGLTLIEDACHAIGTSYVTSDGSTHKIGACAHSDMTCFSFHPVKTLTMGEGGMVTTNSLALYTSLCRLRGHGIVREPHLFANTDLAKDGKGDANPWYYEMPEIGYNYRATDMQCALGLSQLAKLDVFAERRRNIAAIYDRAFLGSDGPVSAVKRAGTCNAVLHLYVLLIEFAKIGKDRSRVMRDLRERGVGTQVHYLPVHHQPYYVKRYGPQTLPGADSYYSKALSIPIYPQMSDADADAVVAAVYDVLDIP